VVDLPEPSAELVLFRVFLTSYIADLPKKKCERLLRRMADMLANEESLDTVLPIRPKGDRPAVIHARRQAIAMYRQMLPVLLASLGE
jgi:hypothetical protein